MTFGNTWFERFRGDGYAVVPGVYSPREVDELRVAFDQLAAVAATLRDTQDREGSRFVVEQMPSGQPRIHRVIWCCAASLTLERAARKSAVLELASRVLGSAEMDHIICQAHFKMPGDEVAFPWHQDSYHRRYGTRLWRDVDGRGSFVQLVAAVDRMTLENGPLLVIPGSFRQGHLSGGKLDLTPQQQASAVPVELEPGAAVVLGPFTIHGSSANRSSVPRRVFINGFAAPGANRRHYPGCGTGVRVKVQ